MSKENGGLNSADGGYFDIVIGNPPYVSAPSMVATNKNMRSTILESKTFSTLYQKWDLEKIIYFSSLVSAISIERKGVRHVIPTLEEIKKSSLKLKFEGIVKQPD